MNKVRHCWPGTSPHLRLVPKEAPGVIPLDTSLRARLMRAVDRVLYRLVNLRSPL